MASHLFLGALLLSVAAAQIGVSSCQTLRGSVTCLDCTAHHNLSGVVVAVKCSHGASLLAAQTDHRGYFHVAMPAHEAGDCAARILGGPEQLCASERSTVARVVITGRRPDSDYSLGSHLAFFTRCTSSTTVAAMAAGDQRAPTRPAPPVRSPPRSGDDAPPFDLGLPLIYLFPFIPIIGIP